MRKYIGLVFPLVLPYVFALGMCGILFFDSLTIFGDFSIFLFTLAIMFLLSLISTGITAVMAIKKEWSAEKVAKVNLIIKLLQIPAYIIIFITGVYFSFGMMLLTPFAGILFVLFDCAVIFMTGVIGTTAAWRCYKENYSDKGILILLGIGQFIFCIDIVCALLLFAMTRSARK